MAGVIKDSVQPIKSYNMGSKSRQFSLKGSWMPSIGQLLWDARRGKFHRPTMGRFACRQKVTFKDMISGVFKKFIPK